MDGPALTELIWPKTRASVDTVKSILVQYPVSAPSSYVCSTKMALLRTHCYKAPWHGGLQRHSLRTNHCEEFTQEFKERTQKRMKNKSTNFLRKAKNILT